MNADLQAKLERDSLTRLTSHGFPKTPGKDYELHLMARHFRLAGFERAEIQQALADMVTFLPASKRADYVEDILNSIIVGFLPEEMALPVFMARGKRYETLGVTLEGD